MKTNEAPEKIYLQPSAIEQLPYQNIAYTKPLADNSIEYTRTDVFIEKAVDWLKSNIKYYLECDGYSECPDFKMYVTDDFYEDFKKAIKGE